MLGTKSEPQRMVCATSGVTLDKDGVEHAFRRGDLRSADDTLVKLVPWAWVPEDGTAIPNLDRLRS